MKVKTEIPFTGQRKAGTRREETVRERLISILYAYAQTRSALAHRVQASGKEPKRNALALRMS